MGYLGSIFNQKIILYNIQYTHPVKTYIKKSYWFFFITLTKILYSLNFWEDDVLMHELSTHHTKDI